MKKYERQAVIALAEEAQSTICAFCQYGKGNCYNGWCFHFGASFMPGGPPVMQPGMDCWAFRTRLTVADIADIVGIILQRQWASWEYSFDGDKLKVAGITIQLLETEEEKDK